MLQLSISTVGLDSKPLEKLLAEYKQRRRPPSKQMSWWHHSYARIQEQTSMAPYASSFFFG
jgi:hypothetical protein